MNVIEDIKSRARLNKKKIILTESMDERVIEAVKIITSEDIADIILIGNKDDIKELIDIKKVCVVNPTSDKRTSMFIDKLYELRKEKGMSREEAKNLILSDYMYYACMILYCGYADGVVSGACHSSSNTLRPALQILKNKCGNDIVSAFFLMEVPNCKYGEKGTFIFSDAGLNQNPNSLELSCIARSSADSFSLLVGKKPVVAMLSHSTYGSSKHNDVDKVVEAVKIVKEKYPNYCIDGELQLDAAIDSFVAEKKAPNSKVAGHANVLVFPDLDAGNIGYKLVERLAKANAYGPITQGLLKPVNDLSRGCSALDIVGVVAITAVQAINNN